MLSDLIPSSFAACMRRRNQEIAPVSIATYFIRGIADALSDDVTGAYC